MCNYTIEDFDKPKFLVGCLYNWRFIEILYHYSNTYASDSSSLILYLLALSYNVQLL